MGLDYSNPALYMGPVTAAYGAYANDSTLRGGAASGGVVSALLIYLLASGRIDGAFVSRQTMQEGRIVVESYIATTEAEILDARTSIYTYFPIEKSFAKIDGFKGRLGLVLLPCSTRALRNYVQKRPELSDKIAYVISLFCGGVADEELMMKILQKNHLDPRQIQRIYARKGHWRGQTILQMQNGEERYISYTKNWSTYKNAFFYSTSKCFSCADHFGYEADFSCGDIWLREMKQQQIKHTAIVAKNPAADSIIKAMMDEAVITAKQVEPSYIMKGNKRALIYKYHTAEARQKLAPRFNLRYTGKPLVSSKWYHYVAAWFILHNIKASKNPKAMNRLFKMPKKIVYLYMLWIRFLINR